MKNWKTAAGLAVAILALGGLATWDEWKTKKEEKDKETSNLLSELKPDQIKKFHYYTVGDAETDGDKVATSTPADPKKVVQVEASLNDNIWSLTSPVSEKADQQVIQDLLKNVLDYKYEKEVASTKDQWAQFGVSNPRRKIELETNDGKKTTIYVGINAPVGFSAYVATDKSEQVFAGSQHIATSMSKTLFDFRDKKLISASSSEVESVSLKVEGSKPIALAKKDGKWFLTSPENVEADTVQVNNFLDDLTSIKATEFVENASKDIKDSLIGSKAFTEVELTLVGGAKSHLVFGKPKTGFYASLNPNQKIIKISDDLTGKVSKNLNDLRNKKIFSFQSAQVESVEIDEKTFKRVKDEWYSLEDSSKFGVDGVFKGKENEKPTVRSHIRSFLVDLEYSKAENVITPDAADAKKLPKSPKNKFKLTFSEASKQAPITIDVWQAADSPDMIYIRQSGSDKVFKAKSTVIASMNDAPKLPVEVEGN